MKYCEYCQQPMQPWKHRFCDRKCSIQYTWIDRMGDGLRLTDIIQRDKERKAMEIKYGFVVRDKLFDLHEPPKRIQTKEINFIYNQRMKEITGEPRMYLDGEITLNELLSKSYL